MTTPVRSFIRLKCNEIRNTFKARNQKQGRSRTGDVGSARRGSVSVSVSATDNWIEIQIDICGATAHDWSDGRPADLVERLEALVGRVLRPEKHGPKAKKRTSRRS